MLTCCAQELVGIGWSNKLDFVGQLARAHHWMDMCEFALQSNSHYLVTNSNKESKTRHAKCGGNVLAIWIVGVATAMYCVSIRLLRVVDLH